MFKTALIIMYTLIAYGMANLLISWELIRIWMRHVVRLPLVRAFDRLPARIGGWFFSIPSRHARRQIVGQQLSALRTRLDPALMNAWDKSYPWKGFSWVELEEEFEKIKDDQDLTSLIRLLYRMLEAHWLTLPVRGGVSRSTSRHGDEARRVRPTERGRPPAVRSSPRSDLTEANGGSLRNGPRSRRI